MRCGCAGNGESWAVSSALRRSSRGRTPASGCRSCSRLTKCRCCCGTVSRDAAAALNEAVPLRYLSRLHSSCTCTHQRYECAHLPKKILASNFHSLNPLLFTITTMQVLLISVRTAHRSSPRQTKRNFRSCGRRTLNSRYVYGKGPIVSLKIQRCSELSVWTAFALPRKKGRLET